MCNQTSVETSKGSGGLLNTIANTAMVGTIALIGLVVLIDVIVEKRVNSTLHDIFG